MKLRSIIKLAVSLNFIRQFWHLKSTFFSLLKLSFWFDLKMLPTLYVLGLWHFSLFHLHVSNTLLISNLIPIFRLNVTLFGILRVVWIPALSWSITPFVNGNWYFFQEFSKALFRHHLKFPLEPSLKIFFHYVKFAISYTKISINYQNK